MQTRYVNTASTAGGDGTTNATTGANRAYASLNEALGAFGNGSLSDAYTIWCEGSAADTTPCTQGVWQFSTTSTNSLLITVAPDKRHRGRWDTERYRLAVTDSSVIYNSNPAHVRLEWLQVQLTVTTSTGAAYNGLRLATNGNENVVVAHSMHGCIVRVVETGTDNGTAYVNSAPPGGGTCIISNCVAYGGRSGFAGDAAWAAANLRVYNCTSYGSEFPFVDPQLCVNCIGAAATGGAGAFVGTGTTNHSNNAADDTSAGGANARDNQTFSFLDAANGDFHLLVTDTGARGFGLTDPASGAFLDDIDGATRIAPWDIGADQTVPPQIARPSSTVTAGAWTPAGAATLHEAIDEPTAIDTDYATTSADSAFEVALAAISTPQAGTQTLRVRAEGSPLKKLVARLLEGANVRATITIDPLTTVETTYTATASGIANYGALDVDCTVSAATSPPAPGVTFGAIGTGANGGATVAPSYPAGITAGQYLTLHVTSGATNSETPTTPAGWTLLATGASTDGAFGIDTGPRRATVFGKVAAGTETGTLSVSITNGNTCRGSIARWTAPAGHTFDVVGQGANDSTSGTGFSAATAAIAWTVGDAAAVIVGQRVDSATQSAQSLTAAGITFGARTNRETTAVTTGNDHRHVIDTLAAVTAGTASVATTWAYTASAAVSGGLVVVRLRAVPPTELARVTWIEFEAPEAAASGGVALSLASTDPREAAAAAVAIAIAANLASTTTADTHSANASVSAVATLTTTDLRDTAAIAAQLAATATLTATDATDQAAAALTSVQSIAADLSSTDMRDATAAATAAPITATLESLETRDLASASTSAAIAAALTALEARDIASAAASAALIANLTGTEAAGNAAATATVNVILALATADNRDAATAIAQAVLAAALIATDAADRVDAQASTDANLINAALNSTDARDTAANITAQVIFAASLIATDARDSATASLQAALVAQLAGQDARDGATATATAALVASLQALDAADAASILFGLEQLANLVSQDARDRAQSAAGADQSITASLIAQDRADAFAAALRHLVIHARPRVCTPTSTATARTSDTATPRRGATATPRPKKVTTCH